MPSLSIDAGNNVRAYESRLVRSLPKSNVRDLCRQKRPVFRRHFLNGFDHHDADWEPVLASPQSAREAVGMYERFSDHARKVMQLANQETVRFSHDHTNTEHILLALIKEGSGVAAAALEHLGIELRKLRTDVEVLIHPGEISKPYGKLPQTQQAKNVVQYAIREAESLNHDYVGTEHILIGLMRETAGAAAMVLANNGLTVENVRSEVLRLLNAGIRVWPLPARLSPRPLYGQLTICPRA